MFLSAADGVDRGMRFAFYRATDGSLLFRDSAPMREGQGLFRSIVSKPDGLQLRYSRARCGACSVVADGPDCRPRIAKDPALPPVPVPDCASAYRKSKRDTAVGFWQAQKRSNADCVAQEIVRR